MSSNDFRIGTTLQVEFLGDRDLGLPCYDATVTRNDGGDFYATVNGGDGTEFRFRKGNSYANNPNLYFETRMFPALKVGDNKFQFAMLSPYA